MNIVFHLISMAEWFSLKFCSFTNIIINWHELTLIYMNGHEFVSVENSLKCLSAHDVILWICAGRRERV